MANRSKQTGRITIISGERNSGKTLLCLVLKDILIDSGRKVSGVISPGFYKDGRKIGILAENGSSGERRKIADLLPGWDISHPERIWKFDLDAVAWINDCLKTAKNADFLILDELGFMELLENGGWSEAVTLLDKADFEQAFVVIRPELLEIARERWRKAEVIQVMPEHDLLDLVNQLLRSGRDKE